MLDDELYDILREDEWLDCVFGNDSRLDNEKWLTKVSTEPNAKWLLEPLELRQKVLTSAKVDKKH